MGAFTLKAMCSKKWAVPLFFSLSAREPASIQTPTVAVCEAGFSSDATVKPLGKMVLRKVGSKLVAVAKLRRYYEIDILELLFFFYKIQLKTYQHIAITHKRFGEFGK